MAQDIDPFKLSSPRIFLVRMLVFLILCSLVVVVLYRQIWTAFLANPGLNGLIIGVLVIGILLAFRQVIRLFPEVNWVNGFRLFLALPIPYIQWVTLVSEVALALWLLIVGVNEEKWRAQAGLAEQRFRAGPAIG